MNSNEQDPFYTAVRKIGSRGLVIFDRDGTLLRRKSPARDLTLGDVSNEFVDMLKKLRKLHLRFGFISDEGGMDARSRGRSEFAALIRLLDQLLDVRGAMPDFWISRGAIKYVNGGKIRDQDKRWQTVDTGLILRAIEWYGVDKSEAVLVSNTGAGLLAANEAGVMGIQYLDQHDDRAGLPRAETTLHDRTSSEALEIERLRLLIQQFLGIGDSRIT
ncbi:hypothetical protein [Agrobacterium tumefaciens]|uniref:hypothetical protein n=1 Tax=Agrobacterium tumefaciens TaxID=358 RepID=UPI001574AD73|nr:hypothetical protein [Agrobacterium tumefaciens]